MSVNRFIKFGSPLILLVVGGSYGLREFQQIKYDYSASKGLSREEAAAAGIKMKKKSEVTLEKVMEKIEQIDTDNWENKRGPRPWEKDNVLYQEALQRAQQVKDRAR